MVGKYSYSILRVADSRRGERVRSILKKLFPNKSNVAIGQELGYDESSIRVWTKTGVISPALVKHLARYGVSEKYILTGNGTMLLQENEIAEVRPLHHKMLMQCFSMEEAAVRISRFLAGDEDVAITTEDITQLQESAENLSSYMTTRLPPDTPETVS